MKPDGETPSLWRDPTRGRCSTWYLTVKHPSDEGDRVATDFEKGVLVGLLVGEGTFGGDGRQPQVTLRMHVRHAALFAFIERTFPGGRVYGPYHHGGRHYLQWMARGTFLREELLPLLEEHVTSRLDDYSRTRLDQMCRRYARRLGRAPVDDAAADDVPQGSEDDRVAGAFETLRTEPTGPGPASP